VGRHPALGGGVTTAASAGTLLDPSRAVLAVVDLQEKLLPAIDERERVLHNSLLLLRLAQVLELPVILTTQYRKGLGGIVPEVARAAPGIAPLDKVAFGCFGSAEFEARMAQCAGRDQLVVAGIESHICVAQTALGALAKGFTVHVASDAVGSRTAENRAIGLRRMETAGAVVTSAEMAIYELLRRSDAAAFKAMLPHLRG
jgi:nicotinamidase-related amidase